MIKQQRDPSVGPFIALGDIDRFKQYCTDNGYHVRLTKAFTIAPDFDVRYDGHWMCVKWNKITKRMTADRRLAPIVEQFKAAR